MWHLRICFEIVFISLCITCQSKGLKINLDTTDSLDLILVANNFVSCANHRHNSFGVFEPNDM